MMAGWEEVWVGGQGEEGERMEGERLRVVRCRGLTNCFHCRHGWWKGRDGEMWGRWRGCEAWKSGLLVLGSIARLFESREV
jgi:hypothetical protein